jgi:hypothetical protein
VNVKTKSCEWLFFIPLKNKYLVRKKINQLTFFLLKIITTFATP